MLPGTVGAVDLRGYDQPDEADQRQLHFCIPTRVDTKAVVALTIGERGACKSSSGAGTTDVSAETLHRLVHEGGIRVEILDDGAFRFLKLDGTSIDSIAPGYTQPISDWRRLPAIHRENGIHIDRKTAATRWRGERMDYGLAVEVLAIKQAKVNAVAACRPPTTPEMDAAQAGIRQQM